MASVCQPYVHQVYNTRTDNTVSDLVRQICQGHSIPVVLTGIVLPFIAVFGIVGTRAHRAGLGGG